MPQVARLVILVLSNDAAVQDHVDNHRQVHSIIIAPAFHRFILMSATQSLILHAAYRRYTGLAVRQMSFQEDIRLTDLFGVGCP